MKSNGSFRPASARLHAAISALPHASAFVVGAAALILAGTTALHAADLTWDADTGTTSFQAGTGNWTTAGTNWWNGSANASWVNTVTTNFGVGFIATLGGADGTYTLTTTAPIIASNLNVQSSGYTLVNSGANFLTLTFTTTTGTGTFTPAASQIFVAAGKTFNIGTGSDSTIVKANGGGASTSSQIHVDTGSVLNINAGASLLRDNNAGANNGGIRFTGSGTVNLFGTVSNTSNADGIRIGEYDANSVTFNVKNGGLLTTASSGANVSGGALTVAGGSGTATSGTVTLNIESGGTVSVTNPASTQGFSIARQAGAVGIANVSGTLITPKIVAGNGAAGAVATLNLDGGTLRANRNEAAFIANLNSSTFSVNVKAGGATIDSNGFNIGTSQPLLNGTGGGGLIKSGTGALTLSGANTYTGATNVNGGTLLLNSTNTSNVVVNGSGSIGGVGGSTSGSLLTNTGANLLTNLTGTALTVNGGVNFAGLTTVSFNGTPVTNTTYDVLSYAGGLSGLGNLVPTSRASITDTGTKITATVGTIGTRTWSTTSGSWDIGQSANWAEGDTKFFNGDTVVFANPASSSVITLSNNLGALQPAAVSVNNTNDYTFSGSGVIAGTGALTKDGTGALSLATANTYSGGTTLNAGTLVLNNASAIGAGALAIAGGALDSTTAATLSANNAVNVSGDFAFTGTSNLNLGNGNVVLTGGDRAVNVVAGTLTVGKITNATGGFAKNGSGTLTLNPSGVSSLAGTLAVNAGTLNIGAQDLTATGLSGSGTLANGSATTRWLLVTNAVDNTFDGVLQDGGGAGKLGFSKAGAGATTLTGVNTLSDVVTVNEGTLKFSGAGSLANAGSYVINTNAVLKVSAPGQLGGGLINITSGGAGIGTANRLEIGGGATLSGPITLAPRNEAVLNSGVATDAIRNTGGDNTLSGAITIVTGGSQSRVQSDAGSLTLSGNITTTATSARNLYLQGASNGTVSGVIADNSGNAAGKINLFKEGAGVWTISGANTYTGTTTVSGGTLVIGGSGSINTTSGLTVAAGAGFKYNSSTPYTGGAINNNGTISGTGALNVAITLDSLSDHLAPGNSPGVQPFAANQTWSSFTYEWEVNDFTGITAGTAFDQVAITGSLALTGGSGAYVLNVLSLDAGNVTGLAPNFSEVARSWTIASTTGGITGFDAANWTIDVTGFLNPEAGTFTLAESAGNLVLSYAPIPEPSTYAALAGLGMLGFAVYRRRRNAKGAAA
jgi:fibronectin-binding autotransporter adhesin